MKNFGINQVGTQVPKFQHPWRTLQTSKSSGTWGNRGQGNELQSAFENGLSWIGDKIMNFGDYVDQGISYLAGALPGGQTAEEALQDKKNEQLAKNSGQRGYVDHYGNYKLFPTTGVGPQVGIKDWGSLYKQVADKTKIVAKTVDDMHRFRRATDGADRFIAGKQATQALENSRDFIGYSAHGMSKGSDADMLATLRTILRYGTDPKRNFFTAPVAKMDPRLHSAMGTASGHAYSDGPFMLLTKNPLNTTKPGAFSHVLINDGLGKESLDLANKYKQILQKEFPSIKTLLYSEIK